MEFWRGRNPLHGDFPSGSGKVGLFPRTWGEAVSVEVGRGGSVEAFSKGA